MSKFNSKKKYQNTQTSGGGGNIRRMKLVVGVNIVRVIEDNFEDTWVHYFKNADGDKRMAICLGKGKCPLCEKCGKSEKATHRFYFNVIDRKEQKESGETVVKVMEVGKTIYEQIRDLALDDEYGDPTQYNIKINRKGEGLKTKYSVRASTKQYDLTKDEKELLEAETEDGGVYDLKSFVQKQTKGELIEMLGGDTEEEEVEDSEDGEEDEDSEKPHKSKKKIKKTKPVEEDVDDDDDDDEPNKKDALDIDEALEDLEDEDDEEEKDDDDDEEDPAPKKKNKTKKKSKKKDDDDDEEEEW